MFVLLGAVALTASVALDIWLLTRPRRDGSRRRDVRQARRAQAEAERRRDEVVEMLTAIDLVVAEWSDAESVIATRVREITRQPSFIRSRHDRSRTPLNPDLTMES